MRASRRVAITVISLAALLLGACATSSTSGTASGESGTTGTSQTPDPATTVPETESTDVPPWPDLPIPSGAPTVPTDPSPKNLVLGIIEQVGSGPCYTVTKEDGNVFALVGGTGTYTVGTLIRAWFSTSPAIQSASCEGVPVRITKIEVVG
jgi:hypothetical protein